MELIVNGNSVDEPLTDRIIERSIRSLTGQGDSFAILAKADQIFVQTSGGPDIGFVLEYRDGSEDQHFSCSNFELSADQVIRTFQRYLADDPRWKSDLVWQDQVWDYTQSGSGGKMGLVIIGLAISAAILWKFFFAT